MVKQGNLTPSQYPEAGGLIPLTNNCLTLNFRNAYGFCSDILYLVRCT